MSDALSLQFIENTTGMQVGAHDVSCPLCGPDRKSAHNRVRRALPASLFLPHLLQMLQLQKFVVALRATDRLHCIGVPLLACKEYTV